MRANSVMSGKLRLEHLRAEVRAGQQNVVAVRAGSATLCDFLLHAPADDVARRQVSDGEGVALHEAPPDTLRRIAPSPRAPSVSRMPRVARLVEWNWKNPPHASARGVYLFVVVEFVRVLLFVRVTENPVDPPDAGGVECHDSFGDLILAHAPIA